MIKHYVKCLKTSDDSERELELELLQAFSCFSEAYNYVKKNNPSGLKCFFITINPDLTIKDLPSDSEPLWYLFDQHDPLSHEKKIEYWMMWQEGGCI